MVGNGLVKHSNDMKNKDSKTETKPCTIPVVRQRFDYPQGCLTDKEWKELVALEYVLTWRYTDDEERDDKRYRELSEKKWAYLNVA